MTTPVVTPPSGNRPLVAVALQFFVNGILWASVAARLPEVRDRTGVTVAGLGLILTIGGALGLIGSVVASHVVERWGTRRVLIVGNAGLVGSVLAVAWSSAPWVLVIGVATLSFADVMVDIAMNLQGSWISARRATPVMNRLHGLWSLGTVAGGLGAAFAASVDVALSVQATIVAGLCVALLVVVAGGLLSADEDHVVGDGDGDGRSGEPSTGGAVVTPWRTMLMLALAGAFAIVMEQTASDWAAFRLSDDLGGSAATAGLAYVAFTSGMTIARFVGDSAQARLGRDTLHRLTIVLATAGLAVAALAPERWLVLAGYALAGCGIATFFPRIYDDAARVRGRRGAGLGAMTAGSRLAGFLAPSLVGALAATSLSVGDAVAIVTLPAAAGFAIASARGRARPTRHRA